MYFMHLWNESNSKNWNHLSPHVPALCLVSARWVAGFHLFMPSPNKLLNTFYSFNSICVRRAVSELSHNLNTVQPNETALLCCVHIHQDIWWLFINAVINANQDALEIVHWEKILQEKQLLGSFRIACTKHFPPASWISQQLLTAHRQELTKYWQNTPERSCRYQKLTYCDLSSYDITPYKQYGPYLSDSSSHTHGTKCENLKNLLLVDWRL